MWFQTAQCTRVFGADPANGDVFDDVSCCTFFRFFFNILPTSNRRRGQSRTGGPCHIITCCLETLFIATRIVIWCADRAKITPSWPNQIFSQTTIVVYWIITCVHGVCESLRFYHVNVLRPYFVVVMISFIILRVRDTCNVFTTWLRENANTSMF